MPRTAFIYGKRSLSPASEVVSGGLYSRTTLSAVDSDLATGNIKSGITVFGKAGSADVQDISDANLTVGEAPTGKTFYAVSGGRKTGTGTKTLNPANETVAAGYYAATTLSAVDVNLAVGNIKDGVNIFGFVGTLSATLQEDITGTGPGTINAEWNWGGYNYNAYVAAETEFEIATTTDTYAAGSMAVAVGHSCCSSENSAFKMRIYMGGVLAAESAALPYAMNNAVTVGTRALSGSQICKAVVYNTEGVSQRYWRQAGAANGQLSSSGIGVGSIKAV